MLLRMPTLNTVIISGNLTSDPRSNILENGTHVCSFRIACNERYQDRSGEWKSKVCYIDTVCWKLLAERAAERLQKGSPVVIEGKLQYTEWTASTGEKRARIEILAHTIQMIEKRDGDSSGGRQEHQEPESVPDDMGDIPF